MQEGLRELPGTGRAAGAEAGTTRLSGTRLRLARGVWLALVLPSLGLFVAGLPAFYERLRRPCVDPAACNVAGALPAAGLQALAALGVSAGAYAAAMTVFWMIIGAVWCSIGFLIFRRRSDDWLALLGAFFLVMFLATSPGLPAYAMALTYPALYLPSTVMAVLGQISFGLFVALFPGGRLVPRWMGAILLLLIGQGVASVLPPTWPTYVNNWPGWVAAGVPLVAYGGVVISHVYRYRRASTPLQRQQTKWVVLGIIIVVLGFLALGTLSTFLTPNPDHPDVIAFVQFMALQTAYPLLTLLLPLSIGLAILRYRLYDIDVLINRTLVYGSLTVALVIVYFGLVVGLGAVARALSGGAGQSPVAIVVSTLAIAGLFQPLRRRIQTFIDRRFYRRKYNATQTLAAFGATLRSEVDLPQLCEHLMAAVDETMQPACVSLWLRPDEPERAAGASR